MNQKNTGKLGELLQNAQAAMQRRTLPQLRNCWVKPWLSMAQIWRSADYKGSCKLLVRLRRKPNPLCRQLIARNRKRNSAEEGTIAKVMKEGKEALARRPR